MIFLCEHGTHISCCLKAIDPMELSCNYTESFVTRRTSQKNRIRGTKHVCRQIITTATGFFWRFADRASQYLSNLMHKILFYNRFYFMPLHISSTCAHHQQVKVALHSLWYHHTYRCDDTRGCVMQFWPPDDKHMCSTHVEAWNKTYCKNKILCIKLVKYWDKHSYSVRTVRVTSMPILQNCT